ncbi:MAG: hypothetical protein FWG10_09410 [Eubacteriaceae bacterium]|nr:hypothetical protein [Eubacteriaceae bacterium]
MAATAPRRKTQTFFSQALLLFAAAHGSLEPSLAQWLQRAYYAHLEVNKAQGLAMLQLGSMRFCVFYSHQTMREIFGC